MRLGDKSPNDPMQTAIVLLTAGAAQKDLALLTSGPRAQPWLLAGAAQQMAMSDGQMPVHMMQMMAAQAQAAQAQAGLGDLSGAGAGFAGAGLAGAWGACFTRQCSRNLSRG